jgi:hypothetical protein
MTAIVGDIVFSHCQKKHWEHSQAANHGHRLVVQRITKASKKRKKMG